VVNPYLRGVLDLRWDDPSILSGNAVYTVVGVNVYRSDASDRGPYYRLNEFPVGGTFWRDQTETVFIDREVVDWASGWKFKGDAPNSREWTLRTQYPIDKRYDSAPFQRQTPADAVSDVTVYIDGVEVAIDGVFGPSGEVTLINTSGFLVSTETREAAVLPTASSLVEVSYYTKRNHVQSGLDLNLFYRLTTVVLDSSTPSGYAETELSQCEPFSTVEVERLDYIWKEAIRRNHWILQQGGERVKIFIRKTAGVPCPCRVDPRLREGLKQPMNNCETCFGTGFVGGYEGPYDTIVAPDDAERRISQSPWGRRKEHSYEVFMTNSPVVTQRDFVVKQTNERYSIGAVRRPTNRGNLLQQHFNIAYLDEGDIRYQVPIDGVDLLTWPETRYGYRPSPHISVDGDNYRQPSTMPTRPPYPEGADAQNPMQTDKANVPDEVQQRGRSPVWENIEYGVWLVLPLTELMARALGGL